MSFFCDLSNFDDVKVNADDIDNALPLEPCGADAFGAPSKKNATGTCTEIEKNARQRLAIVSITRGNVA
jgi:hypothetical protein